MVQGNTVRPLPSTISSTSSLQGGGGKRRRKNGITPWLWSLCAFLFVLCVLLLTLLVMVSKGDVNNTNNTVQDEQSVRTEPVDPVVNLPDPVDMAQRFANQLSFRLQREIKPLLYKLDLFPDLTTKKFNGTVEIDLDVLNPVPFIAIHSKSLQISNTSLLAVQGATHTPVKINTTYSYDKFEYWVAEFEEPIEAGRYKFSMDFNGSLADRIVGFYGSSYFNPKKNTTRSIATSKFEPTYARQAFPCFDEPDKKAEFDISIVRPSGDDYIALSNMNEINSVELESGSGLSRTTFNRSVPMSTYLACFIVCDFVKKSAVIESHGIGQNVELRVYATPHQLNKVDLALDAAKIITERYIKYFDIAYPLPKLDLIAIPDFVSGAMEHWGLVTFRETALLYEKGVSASANKQRVVTVVAHELAHQWFGNMVTMEFWNDLWLNEGFASYIEYMGTEAVFPDWGMREQFLRDDFARVIAIDASLATHPIVQNVSNPDQITEIFDAITYSKGATVIRMLEDIIGPENFRKAVSAYLNKHKYGNAVTDDLLNEIEKLDLGIDIKVIMDTWTRQGGLPVVNVVQEKEGGQYTLTQKRFFSNPENENAELPPSDFNYRWIIPITYFTSANANVSRSWFPHLDSQLKVEVSEEHKWIKFNKDQMGYFLVNYSPELWAALTEALKEDLNQFSVSDRVQLLNDAFLLAEATQLEYRVALELTRYLVKETEYVPWSTAIDSLLAIRQLVYREPVVAPFTKYGLKVIENIYADLGWTVKEEEHQKNLLRSEVLGFACRFGHADALERAKMEFLKWLENPSQRPHPDIRSVVYNFGMEAAGNETTWNQVWELFVNELDAQEKIKLMASLARVQDPSILSRFIALAWDEKNVRRQDYFSCMASIASNRVGEPLVWDYVRTHWPDMVARFGLNERYLGSMIPAITKRFANEIRLKEMQEFFGKFPEAGAGARARVTALETTQKNIKWLKSNLQPLKEWLESNTA